MHTLLRSLPLAALPTLLACTALLSMPTTPASAQASPAAARARNVRQFVYVLRLAPRLHDAKAWTPDDNAAVSAHFMRLQKATADGQVILAGRTDEALDRTFGLVVFDAVDEPAARAFMQGDPAVAAGVMTATLHPYAVALQRK